MAEAAIPEPLGTSDHDEFRQQKREQNLEANLDDKAGAKHDGNEMMENVEKGKFEEENQHPDHQQEHQREYGQEHQQEQRQYTQWKVPDSSTEAKMGKSDW